MQLFSALSGIISKSGFAMELSLKTSESFDDVMRHYLPMVYRIAFTRLGNASDAEDAAQDVFVRYFKADKTFDSEEHRKAFLIRCAVNRANSYATSAHAKHISQSDYLENLPESELYSGDITGEAALRAETRREVLKAVMELSPKYRTVIYLFYFEDMTISQIAAATRSGENTVKSRLLRAREKLKSALGGLEFD